MSSFPMLFSPSTTLASDSRNTHEGKARVLIFLGRGMPARSAPSPAPISPAGISSRCASGFTLTWFAGSLTLDLRRRFPVNFGRARSEGSEVGNVCRGADVAERAHVGRSVELLLLPNMSNNLRPSGIGNTLTIQD